MNTITYAEITGDIATTSVIKKLEQIADKQTVSPKPNRIDCASIPTFGKVDLETFMVRCTEFFSEGLNALPDEDKEEYMDWAQDIMIYMSKEHCDTSIAKIGQVFGLEKDQTRSIQRRIERTLKKATANHNYDLMLLLNDLRKHIHRS